ncbi:MAG: DUF4153 domain-containing protein [Pirellulales bacterium]
MSEIECVEPSLNRPELDSVSSSPTSVPLTKFAGKLTLAVSLIWVVLTDVVLYQGNFGYTGWSLWFVASSALILSSILAVHRTRLKLTGTLICAVTALTALRLCWQGNSGLVMFGILLLLSLILSAHGLSFDLRIWLAFVVKLIPVGLRSIVTTRLSSVGDRATQARWGELLLPIAISGLFASVFLLANPDAVHQFAEYFSSVRSYCLKWLLSMGSTQPLLWCFIALSGLVTILPNWNKLLPAVQLPILQTWVQSSSTTTRSYRTWRNTLASVSVLFAAYLIGEFATMWFREFPEGFYYSGYAHAGAAWLTVALALSTLVMSMIFRAGKLDKDSYLTLLRWAKLWSLLNFVLALCVFNRLWIYIGYNGMTRMRVVALLGVSCVIVGFSLVLLKASYRRSFSWLMEKQILTVVGFLFLLSILPVDFIVYSLNSRRILSGDLAPAVQITEHSLSDSGLMAIVPLLRSEDPVVREGVAAILTNRMMFIDQQRHWQDFQLASWRLESVLDTNYRAELTPWLDNNSDRQLAIQRFQDYVWKWY